MLFLSINHPLNDDNSVENYLEIESGSVTYYLPLGSFSRQWLCDASG